MYICIHTCMLIIRSNPMYGSGGAECLLGDGTEHVSLVADDTFIPPPHDRAGAYHIPTPEGSSGVLPVRRIMRGVWSFGHSRPSGPLQETK